MLEIVEITNKFGLLKLVFFEVITTKIYASCCFQMHITNLSEKVSVFSHFFLDFGQGAHTYCVRLLTYLPGKMVLEYPLSNQDLYRIGQLAGNMNKILQEVS